MAQGRVVIVDDDKEMRSLLEDFLHSEGYQVRTFSFAQEALTALSQGGLGVDVVISDIRMPRIDGMDFAARLHAVRPEIPVILMTAFGSIDNAVEAMRRGAFHYVVKPFKLTEMAETINRAMEQQKGRVAEQFFENAIADLPTVDQLEKRYMQVVLEKTGGRKEQAAQILGINRRTLYRKEREYDLEE